MNGMVLFFGGGLLICMVLQYFSYRKEQKIKKNLNRAIENGAKRIIISDDGYVDIDVYVVYLYEKGFKLVDRNRNIYIFQENPEKIKPSKV